MRTVRSFLDGPFMVCRWRCVCSRFASGTFRLMITSRKICFACFLFASLHHSALSLGSIRWTLSLMACQCWMPPWLSFSCRFQRVILTPRTVLWPFHSVSINSSVTPLTESCEFVAVGYRTLPKPVSSRNCLMHLMSLPASSWVPSLPHKTSTLAAF